MRSRKREKVELQPPRASEECSSSPGGSGSAGACPRVGHMQINTNRPGLTYPTEPLPEPAAPRASTASMSGWVPQQFMPQLSSYLSVLGAPQSGAPYLTPSLPLSIPAQSLCQPRPCGHSEVSFTAAFNAFHMFMVPSKQASDVQGLELCFPGHLAGPRQCRGRRRAALVVAQTAEAWTSLWDHRELPALARLRGWWGLR